MVAVADFLAFGRLPFDEPLWSLPSDFAGEMRIVLSIVREEQARERDRQRDG